MTPDGIIKIRGRSIHENVTDFFKPVHQWIDEYIKDPADLTCVDMMLEYFNSASAKVFIQLLQKLTYVLAMYAGIPLLIISGIGLLFPEITINRVLGVSGLVLTDILHITMGFLLSIFMIVHIYTCTLGNKPFSLFRGMISGYHEPDNHS